MRHQLDFEKPISELQSKLDDLRKHPEAHSLGISFKEEIAQIEKKNRRNAQTDLLKSDRLATRPTGTPSQAPLHPGLSRANLFGFQRIAR